MSGRRRPTVHRFPKEMVEAERPLYRLDDWHLPLALGQTYLTIGVSSALPWLLGGMVPWLVTYVLVTLPLTACQMRALATLLHESAHDTLAKTGAWNRAGGTVFSGYLVLQTYRTYRRSHRREHHGGFGDPRRDPDLADQVARGLYERRSPGQFAWLFMVKPCLLLSAPSLMVRLIRDRLLPKDRQAALELGVMVAYLGVLHVLALQVFSPVQIILFWWVPLLAVFPTVNWMLELTEHFPLVLTETVDVRRTRHRNVGRLSRHLAGLHGEAYHLVHHLSPGIPFWNLPKAHAIRLADPVYRQAVEDTGGLAPAGLLGQYRRIARAAATLPLRVVPGPQDG